MLRQIKGIISGLIVYNYKAYNNEQGRQKNLWGSGQKYIWDPFPELYLGPLFQSVENTSKPGPYALHLPQC